MKLSNLILEEYQENKKRILKTTELFENEKQEMVRSQLRREYIRLLEEMPSLTQAHKDALYMEEQIEKVKSHTIPKEVVEGYDYSMTLGGDISVEAIKEWDEDSKQPTYKVLHNKCYKCGEGMERNNEMIMLTEPPKYQYSCISCGNIEYKLA